MVSPDQSTERKRYDVALSFADEDRPYVDRVAAYLRAHNVKLFYDRYEEVALWGKNLYAYLAEVYSRQAYYTVIFISKHYKEKVWTSLELTSAQERALEERREYILPVRFDDTEIPGLTRTIGYLSLRDRAPEALAELVREKLVLENLIVDSTVSRSGPGNAPVAVAAVPVAEKTQFVAEQGPPRNSETAAPVSLPQQLAAQPPSLPVEHLPNLPVMLNPPVRTPNRTPLYIVLGVVGLCVAGFVGYMIGEPSDRPPIVSSPSPAITAAPAPSPLVTPTPVPTPTLASTPTPVQPRPTAFNSYPNSDMRGGDISGGDMPTTDAGGCRAECQRRDSCIAYSFDRRTNHCYLKSGLNLLWVDGWSDTGVRSDQPRAGVAQANHFCKFNNSSPTGVGSRYDQFQSLESCEQACRSDESCGAFTFTGACVLYRSLKSRGNGGIALYLRTWDSCR